MSARIGVVVFPGSNCDRDTLRGLELAGAEAVPLWHEQGTLDAVAAADETAARETVERLASELLSNPLIEAYAIEALGATSSTVGTPA